MLTTEDADANNNVYPDGQAVGCCDILVTFSFSPTVVGETSSKESGHAESPRGLKGLTPCRHRTDQLYSSAGCILSEWNRSRVRLGSYR